MYTVLRIRITEKRKVKSMAKLAKLTGVSQSTIARRFRDSEDGNVLVGDYFVSRDPKTDEDEKDNRGN